jgi:hypothetical protein
VADSDEVEALRARGYPVLECPVRGIAAKRQWILDQHDGDGPLVMMDDDLEFYCRRTDDPRKLRNLRSPAEFDIMMEDLLDLLLASPLVGIANRAGSQNDTGPVLRNKRMHDVLGIDPAIAREHGFRFDRLPLMEDFDFILQHLTAGYDALVLNSYAKGDRGSNAPGGCSVYRDRLGQATAALDLCLLWPGFVRPRQVRASGDDSVWSQRTDVTVQWARAARAGKAAA